MIPFVELGFALLSPSAAKRVGSYAARHPEKATEHISSVHGRYDGLCHFWPGLSVLMPEIKELHRRFCIPVQPFFSYIRANTELLPHRDGENGGRRTSIIQPIFPLDEYAPLKFWINGKDIEVSQYPAIVDLQTLHSVNNTANQPRLNFQLTIDLPFAEVAALHAAGKLVRPALACP
jgi:hypothetical protein